MKKQFLIYVMCWKSIETKAAFTNWEIDNKWNINSSFSIQRTYSSELFIGRSTCETSLLILYEAAILIYFNVLYVLKS